MDPSALLVDGQRPSVDGAAPPEAVGVGNDLTRLFLPHHMRIALLLARTGHVSGWDPAGFGGRPLVGNPQAGLWYPPSWIAWRLFTPSTLQWMTILHLIWGALGVIALLKRFGVSPFASLVSGVCFASSPYLLAQVFEGHYPHIWSVSWYPWAFWSAVGLREKNWRRGWFLPPILAMAAMTGHAQEAYYLILALGVWLMAETAQCLLARTPRRALAVMATGAGLIALTAALLAVEIVPVAKAQEWIWHGGRPTIRVAAKYHVNNLNLTQIFTPRSLGGPSNYFGPGSYWESLFSIGWTPLILAIVAVARSDQRKIVRGWLALTLLSGAFAWGTRLGLFTLFYAIVPGMGRFRAPARALFLATLGASVLAGFGVEAIRKSTITWDRFFRSYGVIVALLVLVIAMCHAGNASRSRPDRMINLALPSPEHQLSTLSPMRTEGDAVVWIRAGARIGSDGIFLVALLGTTAALGWIWLDPRQKGRMAVALGILAMGELACHGQALIKTAPASQFLGTDHVSRAVASVCPKSPVRIRARDAFFEDLRAVSLGLEKTNIQDSFQIAHAADLYETLYPMFGGLGPPRLAEYSRPDVWRAVLQRMNASIIVTDRDVPKIGWPIAVQGDGFVVRADPDPLPRAYVVPHVVIAREETSVLARFVDVSPREAVLMPLDPLGSELPRQSFLPATYDSFDPDYVDISVKTQAPGLLVIADTWMPGWSARLNGQPTPIYRGNRAQRVIALHQTGLNHVVLRYVPPGQLLGAVITAMAVLLWLLGFGVLQRNSRYQTA